MFLQLPCHKTHHDLRPTDHCDRARRMQARVLEECRNYPDMAMPAQSAVVDCDEDLRFRLTRPRSELFAIQQFARTSRPVQDDQPSVFGPILQNFIDHRAQRCETDTAGNYDHVVSARRLNRPSISKWSAHTNSGARLLTHQRMRGFP